MNKVIVYFVVVMTLQVFAEHNESCNVKNTAMLQAGSKKYYVETFFKTNWYTALQNCRSRGMHLVSIEKDEEVVHLSNLVKGLGYNSAVDSFWTSGNDLSVDRKFVWMGTGKNFALNKTSWCAGEPNNEHGEEHCIVLWNTLGIEYRLNDINCTYPYYFICEKVCDEDN